MVDTGYRCSDFAIDSPALHRVSPERPESRPQLVVRCIAHLADRILLCRRADAPRRGYWCIPGGYRERGEHLRAAAAREIREETGASVADLTLFSVFDMPQLHERVVVYRARLLSPILRAGAEALECRLFRSDALPWDELAFPTDRHALQRSLAAGPNAATGPHAAEFYWGEDDRILMRRR